MIQAATPTAYKIASIPAEKYHARPEWSQSQTKLLPSQPELFHGRCVTRQWPFEETNDTWLGSCLHAVELEGRPIVEIPPDVLTTNGQRRGKAWDSWRDAHEGEFYLLPKDAERIRAMSAGLHADPKCAAILGAPGLCEESYFWTDARTGLSRRARIDKLAAFGEALVLADIKSTSIDVTDARVVALKVLSLGYHRQIPWYCDAVEAVTGERVAGGGFLFVQNCAPFNARFWVLAPVDIEFGRRCNDAALDDLARRLETNDWTGPTHGRENQILLPRFAYRDDTGASVGGEWEEFLSFSGEKIE